MAKIDKPLKYDANRIIGVHHLERNIQCNILSKITASTGVIEAKYVDFLEEHRLALDTIGNYWNSAELKTLFLAHVFYVSQLRVEDKIEVFYNRTLS